MSGLTAEIVLIDRARRRAEGDVHDLRDAEVFSHNTRVFAREFGDCCSADDALPSEYAALFNGEGARKQRRPAEHISTALTTTFEKVTT